MIRSSLMKIGSCLATNQNNCIWSELCWISWIQFFKCIKDKNKVSEIDIRCCLNCVLSTLWGTWGSSRWEFASGHDWASQGRLQSVSGIVLWEPQQTKTDIDTLYLHEVSTVSCQQKGTEATISKSKESRCVVTSLGLLASLRLCDDNSEWSIYYFFRIGDQVSLFCNKAISSWATRWPYSKLRANKTHLPTLNLHSSLQLYTKTRSCENDCPMWSSGSLWEASFFLYQGKG